MANQKWTKLLDWRIFLLALLIAAAAGGVVAQDTPSAVEVIVPSARMRYGPGLEHSVQHYANQGHILTVLSVDRTSDAPSVWYNVRTPSGVETWIRADLARVVQQTSGLGVGDRNVRPQPQAQATALPPTPAGPTQLSGGTHPVLSDNLCNTALFRRCQDGADHALWLSGYWAKDRYDTWQREGRRLDIVYMLNPCRFERDCPTKEQWEQGRVYIENLLNIATPVAQPTPTRAPRTIDDDEEEPTEIAPLTVNWVALTGDEPGGLPWQDINDDYDDTADLFNPPHEIFDGATLLGRFRYNGETITFTCRFWHNVGRDRDEFTVVGPTTITNFPATETIEALRCLSDGINEAQVISRQWHIKIDRRYGGENEVRSVKWTLEGTYGVEPTTACLVADPGRTRDASGPCVIDVPAALATYLSGLKARNTDRPQPAGELDFIAPPTDCTGTKNVRSDRVTDYRYTCVPEVAGYDLTLTFHVTRSKQDRGLPTSTPDPG